MTVQEAIEKAIEGGWNEGIDLDYSVKEMGKNGFPEIAKAIEQTAFLDPSFWQSLGKVLGWVATSLHEHSAGESCNGFWAKDVKGSIYFN